MLDLLKQKLHRLLISGLERFLFRFMPEPPRLFSEQAADIEGPSTFFLYSLARGNTISRAGGRSRTVIAVSVVNIRRERGPIEADLSVRSSTPHFDAAVLPSRLRTSQRLGTAWATVAIDALPGIPEGEVGWITVSARRADTGEVQEYSFRITNLMQDIELERAHNQGAEERGLRLNNGEPFTLNLKAVNRGRCRVRLPLSADVPEGWAVSFHNSKGSPIQSLTLGPVVPFLEFPIPKYFRATVFPPRSFDRSPPTEIKLNCGGASTSFKVAYQGMLWSANDMDGIYPHRHLVQKGKKTTYVLRVANTGTGTDSFNLSVEGVPEGWSARLSSEGTGDLAPGETSASTLTLKPSPEVDEGNEAEIRVAARSGDSGTDGSVRLSARVCRAPKVYFFSVDSMDFNYLTFNREGTGRGEPGDWLMPNVRAFMEEAASFTNARCLLPSATDMNHTTILTGCYPGTIGIYGVMSTFNGTNPYGMMVSAPNTLDQCVALDGKGEPVKVERIYEVAQRENPGFLGAFLSNKNWVPNQHGDPARQDACQRLVASDSYPAYVPDPERYILGDPESSSDLLRGPLQLPISLVSVYKTPKLADRLRVITPRYHPRLNEFLLKYGPGIVRDGRMTMFNMMTLPFNISKGSIPGNFASDTFIGDALCRIIEEEDPDIVYTNLGALDDAAHMLGSADDPDEWRKEGGGEIWEQVSPYNRYAFRNKVLNIAREADRLFGEFMELLKDRGTYESSIIVFLSDHGMENFKRSEEGYQVLDNRVLLRNHGFVMARDYDNLQGMGAFDFLFSRDKGNLPAIEEILESYQVDDPEMGKIHPMIVFNREEMESGIDNKTETSVNPGEFFSEYWASRDLEGEDSMKWPDLFIWNMHRYFSTGYPDMAAGAAETVGESFDFTLPPTFPASTSGLVLAVGNSSGHLSFGTTHVPLCFKAPGIEPGIEVDRPVDLAGVAPTIYRILGWKPPDVVDGEPLPLPPD